MTSDRSPSTPDRPDPSEWLHDPDLTGGRSSDDDAAIVRRQSPVDRSQSALASRDYRPVTAGPSLISSWLLGPPPAGRGTDDVWQVGADWATLQRNTLSAPQLGPLDHAPTYIVVCGRAQVDEPDAAMEIHLANAHLSDKPYEASITITATDETVFTSPTVELTPDRGVYEGLEARHFPEYVLRARATGGTGTVSAGTNVQLWSG